MKVPPGLEREAARNDRALKMATEAASTPGTPPPREGLWIAARSAFTAFRFRRARDLARRYLPHAEEAIARHLDTRGTLWWQMVVEKEEAFWMAHDLDRWRGAVLRKVQAEVDDTLLGCEEVFFAWAVLDERIEEDRWLSSYWRAARGDRRHQEDSQRMDPVTRGREKVRLLQRRLARCAYWLGDEAQLRWACGAGLEALQGPQGDGGGLPEGSEGLRRQGAAQELRAFLQLLAGPGQDAREALRSLLGLLARRPPGDDDRCRDVLIALRALACCEPEDPALSAFTESYPALGHMIRPRGG